MTSSLFLPCFARNTQFVWIGVSSGKDGTLTAGFQFTSIPTSTGHVDIEFTFSSIHVWRNMNSKIGPCPYTIIRKYVCYKFAPLPIVSCVHRALWSWEPHLALALAYRFVRMILCTCYNLLSVSKCLWSRKAFKVVAGSRHLHRREL